MNKKYNNSISAIAGIGLCVVLYFLSQLPTIESEELNSLLKRFGFDRYTINTEPHVNKKNYLATNPNLDHISTWVSLIGASSAVFDFDHDGLDNDLCLTEVRNRSLIIMPIPSTGERFRSFELVTADVDYNAKSSYPSGCKIGDFNEDGLADVLVLFFGRSPLIYMQKQSQGKRFNDDLKSRFNRIELVDNNAMDWYSITATLSDINGDGHHDIIIGNYFREGSKMYETTSDVVPELHASLSNAKNGGVNRFFIWDKASTGDSPSVTFKESTTNLEADELARWTLAVGAADINKDGLPDLYFANDFGPDALLINESTKDQLRFKKVFGSKGFSIPKSKVLGYDSFKGMSVDFGDVNRDGVFDMFVSNIAAEWKLEESHFLWLSDETKPFEIVGDKAPYSEESETLGLSRSGWGWGTKFGDFDNDGELEALQATGFIKGDINRWPEIHQWAVGMDDMIKNPAVWPYMIDGDISGRERNPFYAKSKSGYYFDIADELGVGGQWVSRGISTTDADGDGKLDYVVANQWEDSVFFKNVSQNNTNQFLGLHLLLPTVLNPRDASSVLSGTPREPSLGYPAIGAVVTVHLEDGKKLLGQVDGGNGHSGSRSKSVHFGLGAHSIDSPITLEVVWRNVEGELLKKNFTVKPGWSTILLGNKA